MSLSHSGTSGPLGNQRRSHPLDDVTVLERVRFVMRQGVVHVVDGKRQAFPPQ